MERIKLIIYAILIGFFWSNLIIFLEYLSGKVSFVGFGFSILVLTVTANLSVYLLFMRKKKTIYALACIPSVYFFFFHCLGIWKKLLGETDIYVIGTCVLWYYSMFTSIGVCVILIIIRILLAKRNENKTM